MRHTTRVLSALAVLSVAGCSAQATPSISSSPSTSGVVIATPSLVPAATQTHAPTPAATVSTAWVAVPEQDSVRAVQFADVVWTGARFVAIGGALAGGGAVLDSPDGLTWHRVAGAASTGSPLALAAGLGGLAAIGSDADGRAMSWHSADGTTWLDPRATFGKGAGTDRVKVTDVIDDGPGWLAVGREDPYCNFNCDLDPVKALVWTSADGLTWTRIADQQTFSRGAMTSVAHTSTGFVAVGSAGLNAAAWTSPDGLVWKRSPDAPVFHAALSADGEAASIMASVASGSSGAVLVAVGTEFPIAGDKARTARAWWSADGITWVEATGDRFEAGQLFQVAATSRGFLAGGPSAPPSCGGGVWSSADGRSWSCTSSASGYAGMTPYAAASSTTIEVVVGLDSSTHPDQGFPGGIWWRPVQ